MKRIPTIILAFALVLALFACGEKTVDPGAASTPTPGANDPAASDPGAATGELLSVNIGVTDFLGGFIAGSTPNASFVGCDAVFDTIFYTDPETKLPVSNILADWEFTDDLTLKLTLKEGIYFSNGEEAKAEDLLFSYVNHYDRKSTIANSMGPLDTVNSKTVGEYTVELKLEQPFRSIVGVPCYLIDESWALSVGWDSPEWYKPVGSGPYYCAEYVSDDHMTLKLRDDYWDKDAVFTVGEWVIKYYPDPSTMDMDLELGNISICAVQSTDYNRYITEGTAGIECTLVDMGVVHFFSLGNGNNDYFNDSAVRQAIAHGVNWEELGKLGVEEQYVEANSLIPKVSPFYYDPGHYEYDPELAKQILTDAGYAPDEVSFHVYAIDAPLFKNWCEGMQYYCGQIGIKVDLEFGDVLSAVTKWNEPGGSDVGFMANINGSISFDPYATLSIFMSPTGATWAYQHNDVFQTLANEAVFTSDEVLQKQKYKELQEYVFKEAIIFPICESVAVVGYRTEVFTAEQIRLNVFTNNYYNLTNLGKIL
jgi:peptide/nickel transport system substrate-binding protein